jgi:hypothetical protein
MLMRAVLSGFVAAFVAVVASAAQDTIWGRAAPLLNRTRR